MKKNVLFAFCFFISCLVSAQTFKGQWKGEFLDKSTSFVNWGSDKCDYVLELETKGKTVTGFSYTYFTEGGKKFYTICRLEGFMNTKMKYIEVREIERTKTNVPNNIRNCFQTHKLTYFKQGDLETLEGSWVPAPKQEGDCGFGTTRLVRRILQTNFKGVNERLADNTRHTKKNFPVGSNLKDKNKPVSTAKVATSGKDITLRSKEARVKVDSPSFPTHDMASVLQEKLKLPEPIFTKRNINILQTIEVASETIKVDLYDNGEIDGDSVSLFYNGKLIASHKRLSDKALTFNLTVDKAAEINELVMYAENLGSIPPNTALMVVSDGIRRFEIRITSDLQKSGVIRFVHESRGGN